MIDELNIKCPHTLIHIDVHFHFIFILLILSDCFHIFSFSHFSPIDASCQNRTSIRWHCVQCHDSFLASINVKCPPMHHFFTPKPVQRKCLLRNYLPTIPCYPCTICQTTVKMAFPLVNYWKRLVFQAHLIHRVNIFVFYKYKYEYKYAFDFFILYINICFILFS